MFYVIRLISTNRLLIRSLLWLRELIAENKIPSNLFNVLKKYTSELSENIPNLDEINKCLKYDIRHLNSREEFESVRRLSNNIYKKEQYSDARNYRQTNVIKYRSIRIVSYQDVLECDSIRDRVFELDINMDLQGFSYINNLLKRQAEFMGQSYFYRMRLSTFVSKS